MKTPSSLLRMAMVLGFVALLVSLGGCRWPHLFEETPPAPPPPAPVTSASHPQVDAGQTAIQTVTEYVTALNAHRFAAAYELLSRASQKHHTSATFAEQGKQGMPLYDLSTAQVTVTGETALVSIRLQDDPATSGFHLVRENEHWKVVYRGGVPGMPSAE